MRVVLYARVSTTNDQKPELQIQEMREYCKHRGFTVVKELTDFGFSGTTDKRPALAELFDLVRRRKVDGVIVLKLDRLFRSLRHLLISLAEFDELGVKFISIGDNIDMTSATGKLLLNIIGAFSEFEVSLIKYRTLKGLEQARRSGKILGRPTVHNSKDIINLRNAGKSYRQIVKELNCPMGVVSRAIASALKSGEISVKSTQVKTRG